MNLNDYIDSVRSFNRFYTRQIGLLQQGLYSSAFPLSEVRVLYELSHHERTTWKELEQSLGIDAGYLSRILKEFQKQGWIQREISDEDRRLHLLSLTTEGKKVFEPLDRASHDQVAAMLSKLSEEDCNRLVQCMHVIEELLNPPEKSGKTAYLLRPHQPGDIGWIVYRHGVNYAKEYGYDEHFEALVAEICAKFIQRFDPKRERCWMAERDGELVGCVLLVKQSKRVARLRVLLVEPSARGLGIGMRLVEECIRFARHAGYKRLTLWTQSELNSARRIYEQTGFRLTKTKRHDSWGKEGLIAETWDLDLS